jgi:hypothetical protein
MNVLTILNELAAAAGQDAVAAACSTFLNPKGKKAPKKERKPRGKSSWNLEVDKVLSEMRQGLSEEELKKVTYKMAYAEASKRRRENNPEAQAKYEANQAKRAGKKTPAVAAEPEAAPVEESRLADVLDYGDTPPDTDEDEQGVVIDGVPDTYDAGQVYRFLFDLQDSGRINMLACPAELQREFGMTHQEADDVRSEYVTRYSELKAKYQPKLETTPKTPQRRTSTTVLAPKAPKKALPVGRSKIPIV